MENTIYQIYDKMFKKILTLSSLSVVNLMNACLVQIIRKTAQ